jgi:hypothetical protein
LKGSENVQDVWLPVGNEKEHQKGQEEQGQKKEITKAAIPPAAVKLRLQSPLLY